MNNKNELATIWEHLEELRNTIIKSLIVIVLGTVFSLLFTPFLTDILKGTLKNPRSDISYMEKVLVKNNSNTSQNIITPYQKQPVELAPGESVEYWKPKENELVILSPTEGIIGILKLSFFLGLTLTSPIWLYYLFIFLTPALESREKKLLSVFFPFALLLFVIGASFCYLVTLPLANDYFILFNKTIGQNLWSFSNYLNYTLMLVLGNGLAFESCAILFALVHFGFLKTETLKSKRRHFIVLAFIIGGVLTPPDILTQALLALPLLLMYEAAILYSSIRSLNQFKLIKE